MWVLWPLLVVLSCSRSDAPNAAPPDRPASGGPVTSVDAQVSTQDVTSQLAFEIVRGERGVSAAVSGPYGIAHVGQLEPADAFVFMPGDDRDGCLVTKAVRCAEYLFATKLKNRDMTIIADIPGAYRPDLAQDVDGGCQLPPPSADDDCRESTPPAAKAELGAVVLLASVSPPRVAADRTFVSATVRTPGAVTTCTVEWPDDRFSLRLWGVAIDLALSGAILQTPGLEGNKFSDQQDEYWSRRIQRSLGRAGALDLSTGFEFGRNFREYSINLVRVQSQLSKDNGWWRYSKGQCGLLP